MLLYFLSLFMSTVNSNMTGYIVGGFLTDIRQWPFITFIHAEGEMSDGNEVTSSCGGSLLSSQTVLSAAHCFDDLTDHHKRFKNFDFSVYMGHSRFDKASMVRNVQDYVAHKKYDPNCDRVIAYDVAVAFLDEPVSFSATVQKVILVPENTDMEKGEQVIVAGWGMTDTNQSPGSTKLKAAFQHLDTTRSCQQVIRYDAPGVICARANQFAYRGDSGGPLIRKSDKLQVGIISHRLRKAGVTVYSSIPYFYSWIHKTQDQLFDQFCHENERSRRLQKRKNTRRYKNNKLEN